MRWSSLESKQSWLAFQGQLTCSRIEKCPAVGDGRRAGLNVSLPIPKARCLGVAPRWGVRSLGGYHLSGDMTPKSASFSLACRWTSPGLQWWQRIRGPRFAVGSVVQSLLKGPKFYTKNCIKHNWTTSYTFQLKSMRRLGRYHGLPYLGPGGRVGLVRLAFATVQDKHGEARFRFRDVYGPPSLSRDYSVVADHVSI